MSSQIVALPQVAGPEGARGLLASLTSIFVTIPGEGRVEATARKDWPGVFELRTQDAPTGRRLFELAVEGGWPQIVELTAAVIRERITARRGASALKAHAAQQARKALAEPVIVTVRDAKSRVHVSPYHEDAPTPCRAQHGEIVKTVVVEGRERRTVRKVADTLHQMRFRTGALGVEQYRAGCRFQRAFQAASLSGYVSADLSKPLGLNNTPGEPAVALFDERQSVYDAIRAVGGVGTLAGGLLWHVVGLGWTVKRFCEERTLSGRPITQQAASGALVAMLDGLAAHYGYIDREYEALGFKPPSDDALEILTEG